MDAPQLDMPVPPPRVVETVEAQPPAPVPLVEEPARQPLRPPPRQPRAESRPEPRPESPRTEAADPSRSTDEGRPPTTLQTTPAVAEGELERTIRGAIARASADLGRVDYRLLNTDARTQYDTAKRFIQQAEEALEPRARNLVFAKNLADKAVALAAQLAPR